jgi:large subunit ribosomal protein L25
MHPQSDLEIECPVSDIPEFLEVNINELDVGHAITAADVKLPNANFKLITDPHAMVAQIVIQQELKLDEAATVGGTAEPEVLTAKKPAEGEAAAGAKPGAAPAKDAKAPAAGAAPAKDAKAAPKK